MSAPRLNRRLTLEAPNKVADGAGGFDTVWEPLGTLWAHCKAHTGREREAGGAPRSVTRYTITLRAAPPGSLARPKPEQRFRDGARIFTIRAVRDFDPEGRYLSCVTDEEVAA